MKLPLCSVFQITEGLSVDLGGTAVAVSCLSNFLAGQGIAVSLFGFCRTTEKKHSGSLIPPSPDGGRLYPLRAAPLDPRIQLREFAHGRCQRLGFSRQIRQALEASDPPGLVHLHGLWRLYHAQAARYAGKHGISTVVSTHGMLEPWALDRKRGIKQIARALYQDRILQAAGCLHTTSQEEAETLRRLGFQRPIAVIPWGVESFAKKSGSLQPKGLSGKTIPAQKRVALFLSRIHPKKGLDLLFSAWMRVQSRFPDWVLVVAGDGEKRYRSELEKLAKKLKMQNKVFFSGPMYSEDKEAVFGVAELFILPSRSENFGLAVAEALARGIPVITTKNMPWSKVAEWGCGWWVDLGVEPLVCALGEALSKGPRELLAMGEVGRTRVEKHFSLEASGSAMLNMYRWVLGEQAKPDFVQDP